MKALRLLVFMLLLTVPCRFLSAQDDFKKWLEKDQQAYENYLEEQDRAFMDFLKKDWEAFQAFQGIEPDKAPKPKTMPVAPDKAPQEHSTDETVSVPPLSVQSAEKAPQPNARAAVQNKPKIQFPFYDAYCSVNFASLPDWTPSTPITNTGIAEAWRTLASHPHSTTLRQLKYIANQMKLNDWGHMLLYHAFSEKTAPYNINKQLVLDWFLLNKSGYDIKLAFQDNSILLLVPSTQVIYEAPYVMVDGQKFYFFGFENKLNKRKRIYTYRGQYTGNEKQFDLSLTALPRVTRKNQVRNLKFNYKGETVNLNIKYSRNAVDFLSDYPQTELELFFRSNPSTSFQRSLIQALRPYVENKTKVEAVNFLLRLAQTAFHYRTDDQQFGFEKYMLPEETLHYPSSDCEDRSILFAFLVRRLVRTDVVLLDYPGHVATAVYLGEPAFGNTVTYRGKRFVICDPTYINASPGTAMPQFASVRPNVIEY
ncbi:MAG: hypothetical protein U5R06_14730 [candidate division KSB1 bacterium]|nr:hypothetical protein [candidate division KSB1 bacterium]